jgi:hypothetical protein
MLTKIITGAAVAAFLSLAGCGKADEAVKELEGLKKRACECKDADCATKVQEDFTKFIEKHKDTKGSQSQADKVTKLATEMSECVAKAMTGGEGAAPPAEGAPAPQ